MLSCDVEVFGAGLLDELGQPGGESVLRGDGAEIPDAAAGFGEAFADVGRGCDRVCWWAAGICE